MPVVKVDWIPTENPEVRFEDNVIGRLKKEVWDADMAQLDKWLEEDFEIPQPSEIGKANCYYQTTPLGKSNEKRKKNDIVFIPVGCTECHGVALPPGQDVFQVSQFLEGVRRYTAKLGKEITLAWPILYGGHPHHHLGMPGTVVIPQDVLTEQIIAIMLGLWNDGYRKIILVNNHGHMYTLVTAIQEFCKRFQLPGIFQVFDWITTTREFFMPFSGKEDELQETFTHAAESETSLGLLLNREMLDESKFMDRQGKSLMRSEWFDNSITDYGRPHQWCEGEGHNEIEMSAARDGVLGWQSLAHPDKAKRPVVAICKLLVQFVEDVLAVYPPGTVPEAEKVTLRTSEEMAPYLKEPMSEGWKTVYGIPRIGLF